MTPSVSNSGSLVGGSSQISTATASSANIGDHVIRFTATDASGTNSPREGDATLRVLDHSDAEFYNPSGEGAPMIGPNSLTIDFGTVSQDAGGGLLDSFFDILAEITTPDFTADLDLDSISLGTGDVGTLFIQSGPSSFTNLSVGDSESYTARLLTDTVGEFSATTLFNLSDQNLPGATAPGSEVLMLTLTGVVIPEPSTLILLATGALGLLGCGWRRRR